MWIPITVEQVHTHPKWNYVFTLQRMCKSKESSMCSWRRYDAENYTEIYFAFADILSQKGKCYKLQGTVYHLTHQNDGPHFTVKYHLINMEYNLKTNELTLELPVTSHKNASDTYACLFGSFSSVHTIFVE